MHKTIMTDQIKEAFSKAKQDIQALQSQLDFIKQEILKIKEIIISSSLNLEERTHLQQTDRQTNRQESPANNPQISSIQAQNTTNQHIPTNNTPQYSLKGDYNNLSTGSDGVPTDRQTNQQTNQHIGNEGVYPTFKNQKISVKLQKTDKITQLEHVSTILNSLDSIKKDLRYQFKRLTNQEMAVFSCIYELENQGFIVDYPIVSQKMSLSESSIRDYIQKIVKKGIPIIKIKENNKKILLKIDENLKKIASLQTLLTLRTL